MRQIWHCAVQGPWVKLDVVQAGVNSRLYNKVGEDPGNKEPPQVLRGFFISRINDEGYAIVGSMASVTGYRGGLPAMNSRHSSMA